MDEQRPPTAIIVAGGEEIRGLVRGLLRLHRFEVLGETSQEGEGIDLLRAHAPKVMIVDASLPSGAVPALLTEARRRVPTTRTVLVAPADEEGGIEPGADAVLHRPLQVREFGEAVGAAGAN